jgi:hypothetical protein
MVKQSKLHLVDVFTVFIFVINRWFNLSAG